jgi:ABC-type proline/glycine betaine transport system permease subunit
MSAYAVIATFVIVAVVIAICVGIYFGVKYAKSKSTFEGYTPVNPQMQVWASWQQGDMCINGPACNYSKPRYP